MRCEPAGLRISESLLCGTGFARDGEAPRWRQSVGQDSFNFGPVGGFDCGRIRRPSDQARCSWALRTRTGGPPSGSTRPCPPGCWVPLGASCLETEPGCTKRGRIAARSRSDHQKIKLVFACLRHAFLQAYWPLPVAFDPLGALAQRAGFRSLREPSKSQASVGFGHADVGIPSMNSVGRERRVGSEECRCLPRKGLVKLEQGAVPGAGVCKKDGVRQILTEPVGVPDGDHLVVDTVHDKRRLTDAPQVCKTLARDALPIAESSHLSLSNVGTRDRLPILRALLKPFYEGLAGCLA